MTSRPRSRVRRVLRVGLGLGLAQAAVGAASAHGVDAGGQPVGIGVVVALTVGLAVAAGLVAVARGPGGVGDTGWLTGLVGPLLLVLGVAAVLTAAESALLLAAGCLAVGGVGAWVAVRRVGGCHRHACANATLGAVTAHRAVEGVALAAVYATGSAVGALGALVVAGHATAETAAVGCLFGVSSRSRGAVAVAVVQVGFLAGAAAGLLATSGLPPALGDGALALVGGVLLVVGAVETVRHAPRAGWVPDTS